jgi:chloramphenicol 3-O-phosphotransferase
MRGTIIDWALDSHRLARNAYQANGDKLANEYYNNNKEIVDAQLLKAGIRLAKVLNDIFE